MKVKRVTIGYKIWENISHTRWLQESYARKHLCLSKTKIARVERLCDLKKTESVLFYKAKLFRDKKHAIWVSLNKR